MRKGDKQYVEWRSRANQVNNCATGKVISVDGDGRHRVELTNGRQIMVYSASGVNYTPNDYVSIRFLSGDKRQAEIAGKTTKLAATTTRQVWR
jgi:translation initiation factor IF-1